MFSTQKIAQLPTNLFRLTASWQEVAGLFQLAKHAAGKPLKVDLDAENDLTWLVDMGVSNQK